MATYANVVKRKKLVKSTVKRIVKLFSLVSEEHEQTKPLYATIWNNIRQGLDYGFDIHYTTYGGDTYKPSLESEYIEYFGNTPTDTELEKIYDVLTTEILPNYINKYDDLEFTTGDSQHGRTFTIEYSGQK